MNRVSGDHHVFLSPHPDDIALSLGAVCAPVDGDTKRQLITVFTKTDFIGPQDPRDEDWSSWTRGIEDVEFANAFSMTRIDLGLSDFPLRTGLPVETCTTAPADAVDVVFNALASMSWEPGATIFAPAGEGNHSDHVACREAAIRLGKQAGLTVLLYADMPYSVRAPGRIGPHYTFVPGDRDSWFRAVNCYPSQSRLVEETVRLVGRDGPPLVGSYLVDAGTRGQSAAPLPSISSSVTAGRPADTTLVSPSVPDGLAERLSSLEQQLARSDERARAMQAQLEALAGQSAAHHSAVGEVRDSIHYVARQSTLRRTRTRVLFLIHMIETWDSCHDVIRAMEASDDFEPIVASIPRHFAGTGAPHFEDEVHRGLELAGVSHIRLSPPDIGHALQLIKSLEPDLIFRQSQWDQDIPDVFGPDRLNFARTCLIPYETMNIVQNAPIDGTRNSAVDMPYHRGAWVVFCANDLVLDMARRDSARAGDNFRVVGHPKADRLRAATPEWPVAARWGDGTPPRRIAWSAHHTIGTGWTDFGAFHIMASGMLAWARESTDTEFVFMPHPALIPYTRSPHSPVTAEQFDQWRAEWDALPNTGFLDSGGYPSVLAASDLLITDGLSLLLEYQLLEKPLIFFEREGHRPFNEIGDLARRGAHTVATTLDARARAERLLDEGHDPLRETQREVTSRLFGDRPSAERILQVLRDKATAERG